MDLQQWIMRPVTPDLNGRWYLSLVVNRSEFIISVRETKQEIIDLIQKIKDASVMDWSASMIY